MCPVCMTTAVLIAGSVASTGVLAAVAMKKSGVKNAARREGLVRHPDSPSARPLAGQAGRSSVD